MFPRMQSLLAVPRPRTSGQERTPLIRLGGEFQVLLVPRQQPPQMRRDNPSTDNFTSKAPSDHELDLIMYAGPTTRQRLKSVHMPERLERSTHLLVGERTRGIE